MASPPNGEELRKLFCVNFGTKEVAGEDADFLHYLQFCLTWCASMFEVCFAEQNVRIGASRWLFPRRHAMRFEWIALLAFRKLSARSGQSWITLDDIARLPSWAGKNPHHIATNVGRYLQFFEQQKLTIVSERTRWAGPYQLSLPSSDVTFDLPVNDIAKRLRLKQADHGKDRDQLLRFTFSYTRAQCLVFHGRLVREPGGRRGKDSAYERLMQLAGDSVYAPRLRLLACIAAVRVLFRLGRFRAARKTLMDNGNLAEKSGDRVLSAYYHLAVAWSHIRGASGGKGNRSSESSLSTARGFAEDSGDRGSHGLLAYYTSLYLTKKGKHLDAILQLLQAVEAALVTGNYDSLQAYCTDLGSIIHRLGPKYYNEARSWLLLGITIARWMQIGRDDAHGEMILGKIYTEIAKQPRLAQLWLQRAERIALTAGNQVNLADVKMVSAFWHQRFGSRNDQIEALGQALVMFRNLRDFDCLQKERYMARKFPSVWPAALKYAEFHHHQ
jgi:hypothetical protein